MCFVHEQDGSAEAEESFYFFWIFLESSTAVFGLSPSEYIAESRENSIWFGLGVF